MPSSPLKGEFEQCGKFKQCSKVPFRVGWHESNDVFSLFLVSQIFE